MFAGLSISINVYFWFIKQTKQVKEFLTKITVHCILFAANIYFFYLKKKTQLLSIFYDIYNLTNITKKMLNSLLLPFSSFTIWLYLRVSSGIKEHSKHSNRLTLLWSQIRKYLLEVLLYNFFISKMKSKYWINTNLKCRGVEEK